MTNNQDLVVSVYTDSSALLDILASIQDGFSFVEKVTTRIASSETVDKNARSLQAEFNIPQVLKISANPLKSIKQAGETGEERQSDRYHTQGSLLNKLRYYLSESDLLRKFDGTEESWNKLQASDFVELRGVFKVNPFIGWLNRMEKLLSLAEPILNIQAANSSNSRSGNSQRNTSNRELDQARKLFNGFKLDLEQEGTRTFIINIPNSSTNVVITLFTEYLRDKSTQEITDKEFILLGKCVRKIAETQSETINLLSGTGLGSLGEDTLNQLTSGLNGLVPGGNLPKIITEISGPALQIVPIAIYI